jgi:hypothetical protein
MEKIIPTMREDGFYAWGLFTCLGYAQEELREA